MGTPLDDGRDLFARIGLANLKESHVNGIWNHILSRFFPYPQFAILPEHWTDTRKPGGSRVDLVVWDANKNAPVFVYEGKGDVEDLRFKPDVLDDIISAGLTHNLNQIRRYLTTLPQRQGQISYGVLAQGTQFIIMSYDGDQFHRVVKKSLIQDENFNNFRDFDADRFDINQANNIIASIATRFH